MVDIKKGMKDMGGKADDMGDKAKDKLRDMKSGSKNNQKK
jgi:hypothetical protein